MPTNDSERTPLIQSAEALNTSSVENVGESEGVSPAPPSYDSVVKGNAAINCRVCRATINIEAKAAQHVVKCQYCNEATPIRPPPQGKKYVRCPCNCLLICKSSSIRIACPRPNCKRVITLGDSSVGTAIRAPAGTCRISCACCEEIFMFNTLNNSLARCPHCRKVSSVGASYARSRAVINLIIALICLGISVGTSVATYHYAVGSPGLFVVWGILYVITIIFIGRFFYYLTMKVSKIEGPL